MRGFTQNRQIGTALPPAVMNRIRRQIGYRSSSVAERKIQCVTKVLRLRTLPDLAQAGDHRAKAPERISR